MVAREGIEPPTRGFSILLLTLNTCLYLSIVNNSNAFTIKHARFFGCSTVAWAELVACWLSMGGSLDTPGGGATQLHTVMTHPIYIRRDFKKSQVLGSKQARAGNPRGKMKSVAQWKSSRSATMLYCRWCCICDGEHFRSARNWSVWYEIAVPRNWPYFYEYSRANATSVSGP